MKKKYHLLYEPILYYLYFKTKDMTGKERYRPTFFMQISTQILKILTEKMQKKKKPNKPRVGGVTQALELLLSKCEALSSNPTTTKKAICTKQIIHYKKME
jgi:putative cell wall-binding protein